MKIQVIFRLFTLLIMLLSFSCVPEETQEAQISGRSYMMERDDFKAENLTLSMRNRSLKRNGIPAKGG